MLQFWKLWWIFTRIFSWIFLFLAIVSKCSFWVGGNEFKRMESVFCFQHHHLQTYLSVFNISCGLGYTKALQDPIIQIFRRKMSKTVSHLDATSSNKGFYQILIALICYQQSTKIVPSRFISFECPLFQFYLCKYSLRYL